MENTISELAQNREQLEAIFNTMAEGVLLISSDFRVIYANPVAVAMLELSDNYRYSIEKIDDTTKLQKLIKEANKSGNITFSEVRLNRILIDYAEITVIPLFEVKKREYVMLVHDVSELKRLERIRSDLVANISHEMRIPLTTIRGYAETLLSGARDDARTNQRFLAEILRESEELAQLVTDLLELFRIESGAVKFQLAPFELSEFQSYLAQLFGMTLEETNMSLDWNIPEDLPQVLADKRLLRQVFVNLVDNAIKYTSVGGRISISAERHNDNEIVVHVADTGRGIPTEALPRIFDRFYRVDKARSKKVRGTGLGLSIVKHILRQHGGHIWVDSRPKLGSVFHFTLPCLQLD